VNAAVSHMARRDIVESNSRGLIVAENVGAVDGKRTTLTRTSPAFCRTVRFFALIVTLELGRLAASTDGKPF